MKEICCAPCYLAVEDAVHTREIIINPHINNAQGESVLAAEHIDCTSTSGEVEHLLPCHLARRYADTFALYAVITAQQKVARVGKAR